MQNRQKHTFFRPLGAIINCVLPFLFWLCMLFGLDAPRIAILTVICALIHEAGHLLVLYLLGNRVRSPHTRLAGFLITPDGRKIREWKRVAVLLGGPGANLLTVLALLPLSSASGYADEAMKISLLTALSSLLPVEGYDGYGVLYTLCESCFPSLVRPLSALSFTITCTLLFFSLYLLCFSASAVWLFGVFFILSLKIMHKSYLTDIF